MRVNMPDKYLTEIWEKMDFDKISERLFEVQKKLTYYTKNGNTAERIKLQTEITHNLNFRCLAVNYVANNSKSAGVDGVMLKTSAQKMQASFDLGDKDYKASPLRLWRVTQKNNGKERRFAIPTVLDRAMCVLQGYALQPVIEAHSDKKSFSFRKGRSRYDAHYYVMDTLKGSNAPKYIVTTDIKSYYATINHDWLLKNLPMDKQILKELLSADIIESGELFPRDGKGISEGCSLSPQIGNFVLDGLQSYIYEGLYGSKEKTKGDIDFANGNMVRYADDIFVAVRTPEDGEKVLQLIKSFVKVRGLELKKEKTNILHIETGFDYLKYHIVKKDGIITSYPSDEAVKRLKLDIYDIIQAKIKNQRKLIEALNVKLRGWGNTYKYCDSKKVFCEIDDYVHNLLFEAVQNLHPTFTAQKVYERYWFKDYMGRRYFSLPKERDVRVIHLDDIILVKYKPVRVGVNPFIDTDYIKERSGVTAKNNVTQQYRPVFERQNGKCFYCGKDFLIGQPIKLITINPTKPERLYNKAYIHETCEQHEFIAYSTLDEIDEMTPYDIDKMLVYASAKTRLKHKLKGDWKYRKLEDYFEKTKKNRFTLSFARIEKISGIKISEAMKVDKKRWKAKSTANTMPDSWEAEGFEIAILDLKGQSVTFQRKVSGRAKLEIPKVLLENTIPVHIKEEIEHYLKMIVKMRGLTMYNK